MITATLIDLIDKLGAEHVDVMPCAAHLAELAAARSPELRGALAQCLPMLTQALPAHIAQEDDVLFPAYARRIGDDSVVRAFQEEHRELLSLRDQLVAFVQGDGGDPARLYAVADRFAELLGSHMTREDRMLFPSARTALA